ncbi:DNA mismatch repair protein MutT [Burkholderia contaminans]|nr:DNA mismatch repair protein MutT [Burkholderia contaminans]
MPRIYNDNTASTIWIMHGIARPLQWFENRTLQGPEILVYRRDDKPDIPFPGLWDLPGGGREGNETPEACVLRELHEEFGVTIPGSRISWSRVYPSSRPDRLPHWFFASWLSGAEIAAIRFGNEGQEWTLMDVDAYLRLTDAIPHLQARVTDYLSR